MVDVARCRAAAAVEGQCTLDIFARLFLPTTFSGKHRTRKLGSCRKDRKNLPTDCTLGCLRSALHCACLYPHSLRIAQCMFVIFPSAARKRDMLLASIEILAESMGRANVRQFEAADMKMNVLRRPHYAKPGMRDGACIAVLIVFALDFECWSCDQPVLNSAAPMFKYWEQGCRNMVPILFFSLRGCQVVNTRSSASASNDAKLVVPGSSFTCSRQTKRPVKKKAANPEIRLLIFLNMLSKVRVAEKALLRGLQSRTHRFLASMCVHLQSIYDIRWL